MKRLALGVLAIGILVFGSCRLFGTGFNAPLLPMLFGYSVGAPGDAVARDRLQLVPGYSLGRFAESLRAVRWLLVTQSGDLIASLPRSGSVILLERDANGDGRSDGQHVLLDGLNRPHGMDLHEGWLYVAETDAIGRVRFDVDARSVSGAFERVVTGLPGGGNHWSRTLRFGPDGWMYVSIGSSCNVCEETDPRRATIVRYQPDGSAEEIYARGLRNSVGFDWQPGTGALYATDNGRDYLGDDFPPCELNRIEAGGFYGWPYANGNRARDPDLGAGHDAEVAATIPPAHGFRAHTAPLGIAFLRHASHGSHRGAALVALHGSWNRSRKDGYSVVSLHWSDDGSIEERAFLTGFEKDEDVIGRPVAVVEDADGVIYVSDDYAGVIWRIARGASSSASQAPAAPRADEALSLDPAAIERGRLLWEAHACAGCHDPARAAPGVVPHVLEGLGSRYGTAGLEALLVTPPQPMPVPPLSAGERADLARYLLSTAP